MRDPLGAAAIVAIIVAGAIVIVDLIATGQIDGGVLALAAGAISPVVPALIARNRNGKS